MVEIKELVRDVITAAGWAGWGLAACSAEIVFRDKRGKVDYRGNAAPLLVHLPAAASGPFPSTESHFLIEGLSTSDSQVALRFTIEESRSRMFSKRPVVRRHKKLFNI